jgi:acyl-CoA dehydrogenase
MIRDHETLQMLLSSVRQFVSARLVPNEAVLEETNAMPLDIVNDMRELGLFGLSIPAEYGGLGLTLEEEVLVAFELGQTSPAFRSVFGTNNGIGSQGIIIDGTEEQKNRYLPLLASGEVISSFALTEPDAGSDAASVKTTARLEKNAKGDTYVLNGTKRYITNAPQAHLFTVMARTNPAEPGARGISAFLVEKNTPGVSLGKIDKKMGQRGTHTCDVIFDDVRVPASNLIGGKEGQGFKTAMKVLDRGRLHIAAVCVGVAERMLRDAVKYATERHQFGQPIAEFQLVQAMLADSKAEIFAARSMVLEAARLGDEGRPYATEASCCKYFASEMCGRVADRSVQVHGGAGYVSEYAAERFYRDVRLFRLYEGTSQIQQIVIARALVREAQGL